MKFQVWYMKPEFFRDGILGLKTPDPANLEATHVMLKELDVPARSGLGLDYIWQAMQAEQWSPNGEARPLIEAKGLQHTSMSVGDVIVDGSGRVHVVRSVGFKDIGAAPQSYQPDASGNRNSPLVSNAGPDFTAYNHGSVWQIVANTEAAKEFARKHFDVDGWQGKPERFSTDWRAGQGVCERLMADGFTVGRA